MVNVPKWNTLAASRPVAPASAPFDEVLQRADAARGDHRQPHRSTHGAQQIDIEAATGAVAVHAGQQDFAGAKFGHLAAPGNRIDAGRAAAAMGEHFPASRPGLLGVHRDHDALAAEFLRRLAHQLRPRHRRRVDAALVGAGQQQAAHVLGGANAAANGQRQEHPRRGARHHVQNGVTILMAGGDVEKAQLVGAGRVVQRSLLHRIAGVAQGHEVDPLDHAAVLHVQAGNDTQFQHVRDS